MGPSVAIAFAVRALLVALFLPFSALDKILYFRQAVAQAREAAPSQTLAVILILIGLSVEVLMSGAILVGVGDRTAAFILAAYCAATAILWKQFWRPGDFWSNPDGKARALFWDFWKNLALAGGLLLLTFGVTAQSAREALAYPFASTHPYDAGNAP